MCDQYSPTHYLSGKTIEPGDRITLAGSPGRVEFVLADLPPDDWFRVTYGEGFVLDVERFGMLLLHRADEDLELVGRAPPSPPA